MLKTEYHRNLPHFQHAGRQFFVTFRLKGTLPFTVFKTFQAERDAAYARAASFPDAERDQLRIKADKLLFVKIEGILDACAHGPKWLGEPRVARIVADKLRADDQRHYELMAYCIMPNHVHAVMATEIQLQRIPNEEEISEKNYRQLYQILQEIKGNTAFHGNRVLGRGGTFWQHESYDHYVRNTVELGRIIRYVLQNPVKAGFVKEWRQWEFSYVHPDFAPDSVTL
jgi:REP element-mobilizing transposase RayT